MRVLDGRSGGGDPVVETSEGRFRGRSVAATQDGSTAGHFSFLGIRYGVADRFMPPRRPAPHGGIADALGFGAVAPQTNPAPSGPPPVILAHLPRPPGASPPAPLAESEDCLFLNIWMPRLDREARLPVMVFLHGGFFYSGSGAMGDGSQLAARGDVVVVSLNHRLNALGFTHMGALAGGEFAAAGNIGMLDIVSALDWLRENIAGFGGDADRIMVFGTSGGGMKTTWLMASPSARGLFARATVQSGPALRFLAPDRAEAATEWLLDHLGIRRADAADLARIPVERLVGAYYQFAANHRPESFTDLPGFAPVIDPQCLPHHPFDPEAAPDAVAVPLLIGANADEMSFFMGLDQAAFALDADGLTARAERLLGDRAQAVIAAYRQSDPDLSPARLWLRIFSHHQVLAPILTQAARQRDGGQARVYVYHFEAESPLFDCALGATHTLENAYVLGQLGNPLVGPVGARERMLARRMGDAWVSFAATGSPGAGWPEFGGAGTVMRVGHKWQTEARAFAREMALIGG